jgi:hypothetical protein
LKEKKRKRYHCWYGNAVKLFGQNNTPSLGFKKMIRFFQRIIFFKTFGLSFTAL